MSAPAVPEWLEPEYTRAALAGEVCPICEAPQWLCEVVGELVRALRRLHRAPSSNGCSCGGCRLDVRLMVNAINVPGPTQTWWCWSWRNADPPACFGGDR